MRSLYLAVLVLSPLARAHMAFWHKAMYCLGGASGVDDPNAEDPVRPLYNLKRSEYMFHAHNGCDKFPPPKGTFLELPAGGEAYGEIASNRAFTSLSYNGKFAADGPGGTIIPTIIPGNGSCIIHPNMHTTGEDDAAGTALAIAYVSDLKDVTPENLVVFSVAYNTPWKREVRYKVPAAMPPCPPNGCICTWNWIPKACGQSNFYMEAIPCTVTNSTSNIPVAPGKPAKWCQGNIEGCVKGPKQITIAFQAEGNTVDLTGIKAADGEWASPSYNINMGFSNGAQNDIFATAAPAPPASASLSHKSTPPATSTLKVSITSKAVATSDVTNASSSVPVVSASNSGKHGHGHHVTTSTTSSANHNAATNVCSPPPKRDDTQRMVKRHRKRMDAYDNAV